MRHDLIARTTLQMRWLSDSCPSMARAKEEKQLDHQVMLWGWASCSCRPGGGQTKNPIMSLAVKVKKGRKLCLYCCMYVKWGMYVSLLALSDARLAHSPTHSLLVPDVRSISINNVGDVREARITVARKKRKTRFRVDCG